MTYIHDKQNREKEATLNDYRLSLGLSIQDVCDAIGIRPARYIALNNGTDSPIIERGKYKGQPKRDVKRLSELLGASLEDLFPRYWCSLEERQAVYDQLSHFIGRRLEPHEEIESKDIVQKSLNQLCNRERRIAVEGWLKERTLKEIADEEGLSTERVRQMLEKAKRKIRCFLKGKSYKRERTLEALARR